MANFGSTPDNDPELYFKRNFNVHKHRELTTNPHYKRLFNPRGFGILLWVSHDHLIFYKNNYRKIIRYFIAFPLSKIQLLYLLENLQLTFNKSLFPHLREDEKDFQINYCLDFISIKCGKLTKQLNTDIYGQHHLVDFNLVKRNLELIPGIADRIKYLVNIKTDFNQCAHSPGSPDHSFFISNCEDEIKRYLEPYEYEKLWLPSIRPDILLPETSQLKSAEYISKYIAEKINAIDASGWKYVFPSQQKFLFFVQLLTEFFTGKAVDLNFSLELHNGCKTRLCPILNEIYQKFDLTPLKTNTVFLSLLKNLSIFQGQPDFMTCRDIKRSKNV